MIEVLRTIGVWLGTGPLAPVATLLGILTTLAALAIVVLELSGRTLSREGIVRNNVQWDRVNLAIVAAAALFVIVTNPLRFDFIHILQRGPRFAPAFAPVIAVIFGLPGVFGYMLGVFINSLLQDGLTAISLFTGVWSALAWVWVAWLPYKMVGDVDFSTARAALGTVGRFYLWGVVVGPLIHLWMSPVQQVLMGGDPTQVWQRMFPMILINHDLPYLVIGPIALAILYPLAKLGHVYWRDRQTVAAPA